MKKCTHCNAANEDSQEFCSTCGKLLTSASYSEPSRKQIRSSKSRKTPILSIIIVLVIIGGALSYFYINKEHGKEAIVDQFIEAIVQQDTKELKQLIQPKDRRIVVDDESIGAFLTLVAKTPSLLQTIEDSLNDQSNPELFTLRTEGKKFGIFPKYVINPTGYTLEVEAPGTNTSVAMGDKELGTLAQIGEVAEYGPFLSGIYPVLLKTTIDDETMEKQFAANLSGSDSTLNLATASQDMKKWLSDRVTQTEEESKLAAELEEKEKKEADQLAAEEAAKKLAAAQTPTEKVVVKEVIKTVPVSGAYNDYFLIPYSGNTYLDASDLAGFSSSDLRIARNEIYARYGYVFDSQELQAYFDSQAWYAPDYSYNGSLTDWEQHNVDLIKSFE